MRETFFRPRLAVLEVIDRVPGGLGDIPRVHQDRTRWPHQSGRHGHTASLADASLPVARASRMARAAPIDDHRLKFRSNRAKDSNTLSVRRPMLVVVLND